MQLTDETCTVCNEHYVVGDTINPNEMEHHEFGLCSECYKSEDNILCDIYLKNGSSKEIRGEDYLLYEPLSQELFGIPKNPDNLGAYLKQEYGELDLVLFPVRGELIKYEEDSKIRKLFDKGYVLLIAIK